MKQVNVCCGKKTDKKAHFGRNSLLQQWVTCGNENSLEYRLSSGKCKGVVPFTAYTSTCISSLNQTVTSECPPDSGSWVHDTAEDRLHVLKSVFVKF